MYIHVADNKGTVCIENYFSIKNLLYIKKYIHVQNELYRTETIQCIYTMKK